MGAGLRDVYFQIIQPSSTAVMMMAILDGMVLIVCFILSTRYGKGVI